ncbi:MAG TPA: thioredoxin domain-containing protein [Vicinamibacteria bacterium]|nr:thioredoxin domain-containing protein [Vicinamibacteria bacterium]
MRLRSWPSAACVALAWGIVPGSPSPAEAAEKTQARPVATAQEPVAEVAGTPITAAELDELAGGRLFQVRQQEYQVRRQVLDDTIGKRLLDAEAAARKVGVDELTRLEVEGKAAPVTEAEKKAFYDSNKARFGQTPEEQALVQVEAGLRQQRVRERRAAYLKELRTKANVRIMLEPPRAEVGEAGNPAKGPAGAPVTVIEFSDFQCPFCARVNPTLARLQETYAGKVRIVFRDLPLLSIHKNAGHAAEAAHCADDQDKFWEMHDRLFANQQKLAPADLKEHAVALGLDAAAFNQCLDSGKYTPEWRRDAEEASRLGLSGTPAFFINGRLLTGAQPYEAFAQIIDEELARPAAEKPAASGS